MGLSVNIRQCLLSTLIFLVVLGGSAELAAAAADFNRTAVAKKRLEVAKLVLGVIRDSFAGAGFGLLLDGLGLFGSNPSLPNDWREDDMLIDLHNGTIVPRGFILNSIARASGRSRTDAFMAGAVGAVCCGLLSLKIRRDLLMEKLLTEQETAWKAG